MSVKQAEAETGNMIAVSEQYPDYTEPYRRVIMEKGERRRSYLWQEESLLGMPGEDSYVLTDGLHTPICVTDRSGSIENVYRYDEYGILQKQKEAKALPFGYTGYHKESIEGLYHVNAREYDSRKGRFLTKDAYRYLDERDPVSFNLYLYAKGNPLRYRDYDGHECIEEKGYWEKTANHVVQGNYTDDVTGAGLAIDVAAGLAGLDLPMDLRDLSADFTVNFDPGDPGWWATTLIDVAAVVPVIGAVKYVDDFGTWGKNTLKGINKGVDNFTGAFKRSDGFFDGVSSGFKAAFKNKDEALKGLRQTIEDSNKRLDELRKVDIEGGSDVIDNIITDGSHLDNGKLKPNVTYKTGEHDYIYKTNEDGLIVNASTDNLQLKTHEGRLNHNPNTYGKETGDHAGHLFGDRFGGSPELDNLVSQAKNVNLSEFKVIENQWAKALENGQKVTVDIDINYDVGGTRPISFDVSYTIDDVFYYQKIYN